MIAVVTGGCKGLGKAFSINLLNRGYKVYAIFNTSEELAYKMEREYKNLKCVKCDITDEASVRNFFYGIEDIDLLINNAAIAIDNEYYDKSLEEFMRVIKTNLGGNFNVSKFASKKLKDGGCIINISSNNTFGNHNPISMDYDASKAGVNLLTLDFAEALASFNIKVLAYAPGWINTEEIRNANPDFIKSEMEKVNQRELLDPDKLAQYIIDDFKDRKSGEIIEVKEV